MKGIIRRTAIVAALLAGFNLALANGNIMPSDSRTGTARMEKLPAPQIVSAKATLSSAELARYQQKTAQSRPATRRQAAGASDNKTVWIVVGVAAAVGLVALLASGGGGGGGGGY